MKGAIYHDIQEHNDDPTPFVWSADPDRILNSMRCVNLPSELLLALRVNHGYHQLPQTAAS